MIRNRTFIGLFLASLSLFVPSMASALSLDEVEGKTDDELAEGQWEVRRVNANKSSNKCGFLSILISTVWRGYGHYCIEDMSSHYKLLGMEGASLGMMATSLLIGSLSNDDKALSGLWKSLFHYGVTLFIASYVFDVFGTFKGNSFLLSENTFDPYGNTIDLALRWLPSSDFNLGFQFAYTYRNERFWVKPYGDVNLTSFSNYALGADLGVAVWYGEHTRTYLAIAADTKFEDHLNNDYKTLKFNPYIEFSLDLGSWFGHLENLRYINRLGVGASFYQFEYASQSGFKDHDTNLVLESALSINPMRDLNFTFTYRYRSDYYIGQLSAPSRIYQTVPVPGVGIFSLDFNFNISNGWLVDFEANFGRTIDLWFGFAKNF